MDLTQVKAGISRWSKTDFEGKKMDYALWVKNGGEFWIWDASITKTKGVFLIKIKVTLPDNKVVKTAYGSSSKQQTLEDIKRMLEDSGFYVEIVEDNLAKERSL